MIKKYFVSFSLIFLVLTSSTYAQAICPLISSIQEVGLNYAEPGKAWFATVIPKQRYMTPYEWLFLIGPKTDEPDGVSSAEALERGRAALKSLRFKSYDTIGGKHVCSFTTNMPNIEAIAIGDLPENNATLSSASKYQWLHV